MNCLKEFCKQRQDYILLIFSCRKYRFKAAQQKKTWLQYLPKSLLYYHVEGDLDLPSKYLFQDYTNTLYVRVEDDYCSLPKKVIAAFAAVHNRFKFRFVFKTDDDQNCIISSPSLFFMNFMSSLTTMSTANSNRIHYGGHIVDIAMDHVSQYHLVHSELPKNLVLHKTQYCNGRFYLLSYAAVAYLVEYERLNIETSYLEDYAIGFYLHEYYKTHMLKIRNADIFQDFRDYDPQLIKAQEEEEEDENKGTRRSKSQSLRVTYWWLFSSGITVVFLFFQLRGCFNSPFA